MSDANDQATKGADSKTLADNQNSEVQA